MSAVVARNVLLGPHTGAGLRRFQGGQHKRRDRVDRGVCRHWTPRLRQAALCLRGVVHRYPSRPPGRSSAPRHPAVELRFLWSS